MPISVTCPSCGKTLKAPDSSAGKTGTCPACGSKFTVPTPFEAPISPLPLDDVIPLAPPIDSLGGGGGDGPNRRPCPKCGEMIVATAAKCRFCGEVFDAKLKKKKKVAKEDEDLTTADWIFCIICGGIACIFGVVYMIQGKPKGIKMVGVSLAASVVWTIVRVAIEAAATK